MTTNPGLTPLSRLTVAQASIIFNLPKWKFWRAIRAGLLPSQKLLNGRIYLTIADIEIALSASSGEAQNG